MKCLRLLLYEPLACPDLLDGSSHVSSINRATTGSVSEAVVAGHHLDEPHADTLRIAQKNVTRGVSDVYLSVLASEKPIQVCSSIVDNSVGGAINPSQLQALCIPSGELVYTAGDLVLPQNFWFHAFPGGVGPCISRPKPKAVEVRLLGQIDERKRYLTCRDLDELLVIRMKLQLALGLAN